MGKQHTDRTTCRATCIESSGRVFSFTCNKVWINILFFSTALFDRLRIEDAVQATANLYRISIITLAISLLCCAVLYARIVPLLEHRWFEYVGPSISGIGIVLLMLNTALEGGVFIIGSILTGCGSCVTLLSIGKRFAMTDSSRCTAEVLASYILASILSYAVIYLQSAIVAIVAIALPFLAISALHFSPLRHPDSFSEDQHCQPSGERLSVGLVVKFAVCAAGFGIIASIMHDFCAPSVVGSLNQAFHLITACGLLVIIIPLALSYIRGTLSPIRSLYRLTALICTIGFVITPLFEVDYFALYATASIGYSLFEILIWVILSEISHRFQYTSVQVFGFGRSLVLIVGIIVGSFIATPLIEAEPTASDILSVVIAVAVVLIAILRMYVLTEYDLALFEQDLSEGIAEEPRGAALGKIWNTSTANKSESIQEAAAASAPRKVPFQRKCAIIGDYYGLTRRETDVFRLLAAGRNSTRIQEELSISAGTVNTHCYHVFQKLGVHRQQEVIDLFESADLDLMQKELACRTAKR